MEPQLRAKQGGVLVRTHVAVATAPVMRIVASQCLARMAFPLRGGLPGCIIARRQVPLGHLTGVDRSSTP